jgi:hypothetical protein
MLQSIEAQALAPDNPHSERARLCLCVNICPFSPTTVSHVLFLEIAYCQRECRKATAGSSVESGSLAI